MVYPLASVAGEALEADAEPEERGCGAPDDPEAEGAEGASTLRRYAAYVSAKLSSNVPERRYRCVHAIERGCVVL